MQRAFFAICAATCFILTLMRIIHILRCTTVQGICVKMDIRQINCGGIFLERGKGIFQYKFEGKTFLYQEHAYASNPKIREGTVCKLRINPLNPNICLTPAYRTTTGMIFIMHILFTVVAIII